VSPKNGVGSGETAIAGLSGAGAKAAAVFGKVTGCRIAKAASRQLINTTARGGITYPDKQPLPGDVPCGGVSGAAAVRDS
jgi:hypothetical protein